MKPVLSVLIDTYNHERYIENALLSAIEQDFPVKDYEILVVDDGSTDATPEIIRRFAPRVRLLRKMNGGQASAFNAGFPELRGEIIALLDGDDWFAPGKLTAVMKALEEHPEAGAVGHGYYEFHESANKAHIRAPRESKLLNLETPENAREALDGWPFLLMGAHTLRRSVLQKVIPIPEELIFCADTPIIMASMASGAYLLTEPFSYYRHHAQNLCAVTANDSNKLRVRYDMLEKAFALMEPLLDSLGVSKESARAVLYRDWVLISRLNLAAHGGSRFRTVRTELRDFALLHPNPSVSYRAFKYLFVTAAALVLPPQLFYKVRDWYGKRELGRFREKVLTSR